MKREHGFRFNRWGLTLAAGCIGCLCAGADGNIAPTQKLAWTENTGWVNCAPSNSTVTVHFDGTAGYLTGCAWGENIGWIKFGDGSGPYGNTSATDWGVNLSGTGDWSGYAWGENVGWLKFNPAHSQATVDLTTGQFDGYAWGENIGWVHFKGQAPAYNVRTWAFDKHPLGTPDWWLALHGVAETDPDAHGMLAWQDYVADLDPANPTSVFAIVAVSNCPPTNAVCFRSSSNRFYALQWTPNLLSAGAWTNLAGQANVRGNGRMFWLADTNAATRRFYRVSVKAP